MELRAENTKNFWGMRCRVSHVGSCYFCAQTYGQQLFCICVCGQAAGSDPLGVLKILQQDGRRSDDKRLNPGFSFWASSKDDQTGAFSAV